MFHAIWTGDALESNRDNLLATVYFSCIVLIDIYGLFLYMEIARKSDKISSGTTQNSKEDFFGDIMTMGNGVDANQSKK